MKRRSRGRGLCRPMTCAFPRCPYKARRDHGARRMNQLLRPALRIHSAHRVRLLATAIKPRSLGLRQPPPAFTQLPHRTMSSTTRDVSHLSDISKSISEPDGSFNRKPSVFRNFVEKGGAFAPEKGRYHLYVSYACRTSVRNTFLRGSDADLTRLSLGDAHAHRAQDQGPRGVHRR